jgi:hypothetical protein
MCLSFVLIPNTRAGEGRFLLLGLRFRRAAKKKLPGQAASGAAYKRGASIRQDDGFAHLKKFILEINMLFMRYFNTA